MHTTSPKILSLQQLSEAVRVRRAQGARIVMCHGVFDLLHPGHIQHFQEASKQGDVLVVTVTADAFVNKGPGRPAFSQRLRLESLAALDSVHYVALSEHPTAVEAIRAVCPDVYVKGGEYADAANDVTGKIGEETEAVQAGGGRVHYTGGEVFSSSSLINHHFSTLSDAAQDYLKEFRVRYSFEQILAAMRSVAELDVLLVGDIIIDQYSYCTALAKSPRESIVAARYLSEEQFAGGSLAIANHLAGLCRSVTLIATLGPEPDLEGFVRSRMRPNVHLHLIKTPQRPTVVKRRFLEHSSLNKMFEVQFLDDSPHDAATDGQLVEAIARALPAHDMVVVSDFGHGLLTEAARETLCASDRFIAVNSQSNSANFGFNPITKYRRLDYGCIHELELRVAACSQHGEVETLVEKVREQVQASYFTVTRSTKGTYLRRRDGEVHTCPSMANRIVDRVGAGDTVFSATAPLAKIGAPLEIIGLVGNCAGAMAVQTVCNRDFIDRATLSKFLQHILK
jgi:rfaE bifunctional protein kinase chain/domain/rfaE bifunctional protein nucleotidyltransferase chain/domain